MMEEAELADADYVALAEFRHSLRQFLAFSEAKAAEYGLTPQQHQTLLAIRAAERPATVGYVAEQLIMKPHSASGLVDRLERLGLVVRRPSPEDGRQALLELTSQAHMLLAQLSVTHRNEIRRLRPMLSGLLASLDR